MTLARIEYGLGPTGDKDDSDAGSDGLIHATWRRSFFGFDILAFADHTYLIDIGWGDKAPLVTLGWDRWHPNFIEFERWRLGPWPD